MKVKKWKIILLAAAVLIICMALAVVLNLPKPLSVSDSAYNLSLLSDGTYIGNCDNGLVKVMTEVDVQANAITAIRIIDHQNGLGSPAETITSDIISAQSIEVDAVSGATASSETILKAVENALLGFGE